MGAVQRDHWYFVALVFIPFLKVAVLQKDVVVVHLEEGMVLDCLCPWDGNLSLVSWTRVPDKNQVAVFHPDYGVAFSRHHTGRVEFLRTTPMDGSISIRNVTHQDLGLYLCSVQTFPQGPWTRSVLVEDLDEPPEGNGDNEDDNDNDDTAGPTPEVIVADVELASEENGNLTVTCDHDHNATASQAVLERMPPGQRWGIIGVCKKVEGGMVSEDYSERGEVSCDDNLDVHLHLTAVELEDGGFYRCTFNTEGGMQTTTVLLTVVSAGGFSLSLYMMWFYIGAGAAVLLLFIIILVVVLRQRRRRSWREEYRVKLHPSQRQPNTYENVPARPKVSAKPGSAKSCPAVYVNLHFVRSHQARRHRPRDK